jgi:hypothetical protein
MRLSRRLPHEAITETVIASVIAEARETGRTQIVADTRCTALRLVVTPSADPRWLLFCYDKNGRLEKNSLGRYPRIGVEEARKKAWELRLQVKGIVRQRRSTPDLTLERLMQLYEDSCTTSVRWGRLKDNVIHTLRPFAFNSWAEVDLDELQEYIDSYPSQGNMLGVLRAVQRSIQLS